LFDSGDSYGKCNDACSDLGYAVHLAEDGHSTWPDDDRSAEQIVAAQNQQLQEADVALRRIEELVAEIRER
jgi:hypothetical protein